MAENADSGPFVFAGPPWVAADQDGVTLDAESRIDECREDANFYCVPSQKRFALAVFADWDLADRFVRGLSKPDVVTVTFKTQDDFLHVLRWASAKGCPAMTVDDPVPGYITTIEDFLNNVKTE